MPVNTKLHKNRARDFMAEILTIFSLLFWKIDDFINSFSF